MIPSFEELQFQWKRDTACQSSTTEIVKHPCYQAIIAMGSAAIPLILSDLQEKADHWFYALMELTGANPVPKGDEGYMGRMRDAWLAWGKEHGYL